MRRVYEGSIDGRGRRVAIAASRFNRLVTDPLVTGAVEELRRHGVAEADIDLAWVPGAFELPLAAKFCAESGRYAGVACLGAVIRGETDHYEYVCNEAAGGIARVALDTGVPCAFGVLTVDSMEQALARTGDGKRHQGEDAARAVLRMAALRRELGGSTRLGRVRTGDISS
jgi:6,7-dimethyl-8-ribityllumazine synthase